MDFSRPGALDLFSGSFGTAKEMEPVAQPCVPIFEFKRSQSEYLPANENQELILDLLEKGIFWLLLWPRFVGAFPEQ